MIVLQDVQLGLVQECVFHKRFEVHLTTDTFRRNEIESFQSSGAS